MTEAGDCCSHRLRREGQETPETEVSEETLLGTCAWDLSLALDFDLENYEEKYLYYEVPGGAWLWQPQKTHWSTVVGGALWWEVLCGGRSSVVGGAL